MKDKYDYGSITEKEFKNAGLTEKEATYLRLRAQGKNNGEIAPLTKIKKGTVAYYLSVGMDKIRRFRGEDVDGEKKPKKELRNNPVPKTKSVKLNLPSFTREEILGAGLSPGQLEAIQLLCGFADGKKHAPGEIALIMGLKKKPVQDILWRAKVNIRNTKPVDLFVFTKAQINAAKKALPPDRLDEDQEMAIELYNGVRFKDEGKKSIAEILKFYMDHLNTEDEIASCLTKAAKKIRVALTALATAKEPVKATEKTVRANLAAQAEEKQPAQIRIKEEQPAQAPAQAEEKQPAGLPIDPLTLIQNFIVGMADAKKDHHTAMAKVYDDFSKGLDSLNPSGFLTSFFEHFTSLLKPPVTPEAQAAVAEKINGQREGEKTPEGDG